MLICEGEVCLDIYLNNEICIRFDWNCAERNTFCFHIDNNLDKARRIAVNLQKLLTKLYTYISCLETIKDMDKCMDMLGG